MQPDHADPRAMDIRAVLGVLWRRRWSILLVTALATGAAIFFSYQRTPVYASTAEIQVTPLTPTQLLNSNPYWTLANMDNEVHVVQSAAVARLARDKMPAPPGSGSGVSVSVPANTQILQITYSDPDPGTARAGAKAYSDAYLEYRTNVAINAYSQARSTIQRQIDELQAKLDEATLRLETAAPGSSGAIVAQNQVDQLSSQIAGLNSQLASLTAPEITPGSIIQPPPLPTAPSSPNHRRDAALGFLVGIALGVGLAFVRERLDDRIRGRAELEEASQGRVLAVVPRIRGWRHQDDPSLVSVSEPKSAPAEAYRTLRTNLQFLARTRDIRVVSVTSPGAGEGKTTTAANIAVTLAQAGRRVLAVSTDLRRPRLHRFFGLPNDVGVTSVLIGDATPSDAARQAPGVENLLVLASGPTPANPSELLSSDEMDRLLQELRGLADFVVIDTAPVLPVTDALIVAPRTDGVILVADAAGTTRGAVRHALELLDQVDGNVIGCVLNGFDPKEDRGSAYRYPAFSHRYRYQYRAPDGHTDLPTRGNGDGRIADGWDDYDGWETRERGEPVRPEDAPR